MGRIKDLAMVSATVVSITALVLETDFNPASLANSAGAGCKTQREILLEYATMKKWYTSLKYLFLRNKNYLDEFDEWVQGIESSLFGCYMEKHKEKYEKQHRTISA